MSKLEEVANGVIIRNESYLAVKEKKDSYWKLPGGGLGEGETPEQALARELKEEIGVTDARLDIKLCEFNLNFKKRNFRFYSYLVKTNQEPRKNEEDLILEWQSLERMLDENQAPSQRIIYQSLKDLGIIK